ncbi:MAG TPA: phosphoribulokinase [Egibacteraceae bacterium]|nr:phosphoribulokinase [Actinomycetota bacterium]HWB73003.1 phosphoribulokinase [Egibacteraceae bacterium]
MPDKMMRMSRASQTASPRGSRPKMMAIAGDSASGKTTLTKGIIEALGPERATTVPADDYHRYDREERKEVPFTPLHPDCNYIDIMEQHLQLLATGQPILKPVYDHSNGKLVRPELVEPREFVIVEGLLPLYTRVSRACFDVSVYLDPPEEIRYEWKIERDVSERGYTEEEVREQLQTREPESEQFIRPQRAKADIVVRFGPIEERDDPEETPLSATLLLRPTIPQPNLAGVLDDGDRRPAMHLKLERDENGRPVDAFHIHGYAPREESQVIEKQIWDSLDRDDPVPDSLGMLDSETRSEPLALTQLILLHHLLRSPD